MRYPWFRLAIFLVGCFFPAWWLYEAAMDLLLTTVEGQPVERREVLLRTELILRNSVTRRSPAEAERPPRHL